MASLLYSSVGTVGSVRLGLENVDTFMQKAGVQFNHFKNCTVGQTYHRVQIPALPVATRGPWVSSLCLSFLICKIA